MTTLSTKQSQVKFIKKFSRKNYALVYYKTLVLQFEGEEIHVHF